jgi:hypothetical protein
MTAAAIRCIPYLSFTFHIGSIQRQARSQPDVCNEIIIPGFRVIKPAPEIAITRFGAGVHSFWKPEKDLPVGIAPSMIKSWKEAVMNGYFVS